MITDIFIILVRFLMLIGIQVTVLNNIQLGGFINPYLYVLFILMLPVKFPKLAGLLMAFIAGITVDMFANTVGMHAAACVCMAYARPLVLKVFSPRDGYEADSIPNIRDFGLQWFFAYSSVLVLIHHLVLFYVEVFRFSEFFTTFMRVLLSSVATLALIIAVQFLFGKTKRER